MIEYNKLTNEIIKELEKVVPNRVMTGADINPDYARDEMPIYGKFIPDAAIEVLSTEEISKIMKICNRHHIPVTVRGAGTGLAGGCVPVAGGVVLSTIKMKKIISYDFENFLVTVEPGVLLNDLAADAAKNGLLYPPDPGEKFATLGGNVSTNAGGMRAVKYGATRDYVRAMTVVLPTGEILKLGSPVSKTSSGYSLLNLIIGSEGTLGVITELTLKLIPQPKELVSLIVPFENLESCIATVPKFTLNHFKPQALEFFEKEILISSEEYLGKAVFPRVIDGVEAGAYLLVSFDGDDMDSLMATVEKAAEMVLNEGALDVLIADTPTKIKDAWAARSSFLEGIEEQTKLLDECDVVVPTNKIAAFLTYVKSIEPEFGFKVKSFGHAGDGNLHIYTCSNDMELDDFNTQVAMFMDKIYAKATEFEGLVSGEHGIGFGKIDYLEKTLGETSVRLMREIKQVFDPNMILNPGKVCYKL